MKNRKEHSESSFYSLFNGFKRNLSSLKLCNIFGRFSTYDSLALELETGV